MAYSANGYNFPSKTLSRVKYDLEYDSINDLYRFKGKPQEIIKIVDVVANDVFFDSSNNYEPVWFDSSSLEYVYGDQVFFDLLNNKNFVVLESSISEPCLTNMKNFINYTVWILDTNFWNDSGSWIDAETWND